jgi:hypothetical protein
VLEIGLTLLARNKPFIIISFKYEWALFILKIPISPNNKMNVFSNGRHLWLG